MIFGKQIADATVTLAKLASDAVDLINGMLPKSGGTMSGSVNLGGFWLTNVGAPTAPDHVVRLQDMQAMPWKEKCYAATKGPVGLSGTAEPNVDLAPGNNLSLGMRVLVWMQAAPAANGIYIVNSGAWTRAADADAASDLRAAMVTIEQGSLFADHRFAQTAEVETLGTDAVTWVDIGTGAPAGFPTTANKAMTASATSADYQVACATAIAAKPIQGSYVTVRVNGIAVRLGDGVRTADVYFSADGGATARSIANIDVGDVAYWVGSVAQYQLAATDVIDFDYLV